MKRSLLIVSGVLAIILVLASAAYVAARMLGASSGDEGWGAGNVMEIVSDDGSGPVNLKIKIKPAPELPDESSETSGVLLKRQDNSLFIGTGDDLDVNVKIDDSGERQVSFDYSGTEVEVVVSRDTMIYQDVTEYVPQDPALRKSGERTVQQVIEPVDSLDEMGKNAELEVWGERSGDRIVAQVVVYRELDF
jgi:hypothetical protein